jgi:hypothetical protein
VSDRYQLQLSIAYPEAVTVHVLRRPTARYLCRVTVANTPLRRSQESKHAAVAARAHTSQRYPDPIAGLLVACPWHSYSDSARALLLAELHSLCRDQVTGGGLQPRCGGQQRDTK